MALYEDMFSGEEIYPTKKHTSERVRKFKILLIH